MFLFTVQEENISLEVDDVEGLAAAATKHLELLKIEDKVEGNFFKIPMDESFTYAAWKFVISIQIQIDQVIEMSCQTYFTALILTQGLPICRKPLI